MENFESKKIEIKENIEKYDTLFDKIRNLVHMEL